MKISGRLQIPISFNLNDPQEREMIEWLDSMKNPDNQKGNTSAIIKKILFSYIDRAKYMQYLEAMKKEDGQALQGYNHIPSSSVEETADSIDEDTVVDEDSLPF